MPGYAINADRIDWSICGWTGIKGECCLALDVASCVDVDPQSDFGKAPRVVFDPKYLADGSVMILAVQGDELDDRITGVVRQ